MNVIISIIRLNKSFFFCPHHWNQTTCPLPPKKQLQVEQIYHEVVLCRLRVDFPYSVSPLWICHHRHTQRFILIRV